MDPEELEDEVTDAGTGAAEEVDDDEEEAGEETAAEEETDEDGDEPEDDDADGDDGEPGTRAQKRIRKLIAERKEATARIDALTKQLDEAKKLGGDDGKAIMAAAEASGILPGLMTKDDAEAQKKIRDYGRIIERYEAWLDSHDSGDELEVEGGNAWSYGKVERRVNKLREELRDVRSEYGPRRKELSAKVREIFELGTAALRAGWKPDGKKTPKKPKTVETAPGRKSPKPKADTGRAKSPEDIEVNNGDDLEAYIMADNRRRKKE